MKVALHVPRFTWDGGPARLGAGFAELASAADEAGFSYMSVMDHFFQIPPVGPAEWDMLEAYTALGFAAANTRRLRLGTLVTGVTYRHPGLLAKQISTLDVLSGGRAFFGIGAAWYEREHRGLGVAFPPLKERFERLEEALKIVFQMWDENNNGEFRGKYYQLAETMNHPQPLSQPHPPVLIGGSGEKKTLRLVAQYADMCNIMAPDIQTLAHKLDILREHCRSVGRDYDSIEKTTSLQGDPTDVEFALERCQQLAQLGMQTVFTRAVVERPVALVERLGRELVPRLAELGVQPELVR
jgi:F420-dependent oxidoreductase-like protein